MKSSQKYYLLLPVVILLTLVIGFILGNYFSSNSLSRKFFLNSGNKIDVILDVVDDQYVDTVNMKQLVEDAIPKLINELDPHSTYIPARDLETVNEELEGHFSGIGVQFIRMNDTITVVNVIRGGPSEKVGLQSGDRIVTINDSLFVGPEITEEKIMKTLRGPSGSKVNVGIRRNNSKDLQTYEITRGDVPVNTVDVAYEVEKGIGLIKINKFGKSTYQEFLNALGMLTQSGCQSFILDLRQNPGGLMDAAVNIINEFLPGKRLIVYTKGKSFPRTDAYSNGTGACQTQQLIVLMDEMSASASEIVAGAIQDNDRGLIIGRRSFGKGLVQSQVTLGDGSALRLTIARYYTPSGRCIQKQYEMGKGEEYEQDLINRFYHGEFDSADSIKQSTDNMYKTLLGRPVYGGGGIMPDIFIPRDTAGITSYYSLLLQNGVFNEFAFNYTDKNRKKLSKYKTYTELWNYLKTQSLVESIVQYAETKGIRRRPNLIARSSKTIDNLTQAYIVRNMFGDNGFYPIYLHRDPAVLKATEIIRNGEAYPQPK